MPLAGTQTRSGLYHGTSRAMKIRMNSGDLNWRAVWVHKKMLAVVVADAEVDGDFHFERQNVGTTPADLRKLADWLVARGRGSRHGVATLTSGTRRRAA